MTCLARNGRGDCDGPVAFQVVYRASSGHVVDRVPGCFRHCLAEVEAHEKAAGIARADVEPIEEKETQL